MPEHGEHSQTHHVIPFRNKQKEHKSLCDALGFDLFIQFRTIGLMDGIAIIWKEDSLYLDNFIISLQGINVIIKVCLDQPS